MASFGEDLTGAAGLERAAGIARRLAEADDLDETLQRIVDLAVGYIEDCDGATLMVIRRGEVITPAFSGPDAREADLAQYRAGEGPCLSAMEQHETVSIDDLEAEERWPKWRDEVSDLGWRSMVGLRLFVAESTLGALDLYARRAAGFDECSRALAQVFASHAAVAMKAAITESGLHRALESRDIIGQAKGVLMERERLTGEEAFGRLRELSNHHNIKVRELARHIAETGELPTDRVSASRRVS